MVGGTSFGVFEKPLVIRVYRVRALPASVPWMMCSML